MAFILGWLLGILSAILSTLGIDQIRKYIQKEDFKKGFLTELKESRSRLAAAVYLLSPHYGTYDRELLKWVHDIYKEDAGATITLERIEGLRKILELTDEQISALAVQEAARPKTAMALKKYSLPFLNANINQIPSFDVKLQRLIIQIRGQLVVLNEEADNARFYYEKTFDMSLDERNREIINSNLDDCYENVREMSRRSADKITEVIKNFDKN